MRLKNLAAFLNGFTPTSSIVCSAEGDDPGGVGGASDASMPPTTEPAAPSAAPAPALTLEQVQSMIAEATQKAHDSAYAKARREYQAKQTQQPRTETRTETKPATSEPDALTLVLAFDDALGDSSLTSAQKRFLRDRVLKEKPDNVSDFVASAVEALGLKSQPPTNPTQNAATQAAPQQPKIPPPPTPPAPAAVADREFDPAFRALSEDAARDMWQAYVRRKGAVPGNPYDARNRGVWREMRRQFEALASTASIQLGARRGT